MYLLIVIVMAVLIAVIVWNSLKIKPRDIPQPTADNAHETGSDGGSPAGDEDDTSGGDIVTGSDDTQN